MPASSRSARSLVPVVVLVTLAAATLLAVQPLPTGGGPARSETSMDWPPAHPLSSRVTITRDTFGVPHIVARDEEAAAFAFGYAMAEDHAAELGRRYLAARGESARHFGPGSADSDFAMARLRNREAARDALRTVSGDFRAWLRAFAAGVNAYVARHRDKVPAWMPVVEPSDPLAYGRMGAVTGALAPPRELLRKYPAPGAPAHVPPPGADEEGETGSNAFALAGSKTTVGVPLLLGNPHLRWSELYWEAHVTVPGEIDFYGSTLVGIPVLRAGFNDRLAYVQTNNAPDQEDIHRFARDPASEADFHRPLAPDEDVGALLRVREPRVLTSDYTLRFEGRVLQILRQPGLPLVGRKLTVARCLDGSLRVEHDGRELAFQDVTSIWARPVREEAWPQPGPTAPRPPAVPAPAHPWRQGLPREHPSYAAANYNSQRNAYSPSP